MLHLQEVKKSEALNPECRQLPFLGGFQLLDRRATHLATQQGVDRIGGVPGCEMLLCREAGVCASSLLLFAAFIYCCGAVVDADFKWIDG